jgi:hypothetical protein
MAVGTNQNLCDKLAEALGLRPGLDEIKYRHWYDPNSTKLDEEPDIIVTEAHRGGAANAFRIYVRDLALAHPQTKIVVIACGLCGGRFDAHAVVHTPLVQDLADVIRPLLPGETIDA